jgi:amino acid transporter
MATNPKGADTSSLALKDLNGNGNGSKGTRSSAESYSHDLEMDIQHGETTQLKRKLKSRHLQMIAIGGTIGTGLFIGSGSALSKSGPAGALIAYAFVGTIVYSVMMALGEMATFIPIPGAFTAYAARFVDPSLGFAMGW